MRRSLPTRLYTTRKGGKVYYRWRHPATRKEYGLGTDRRQAIQDAMELNARYEPERLSRVIDRIETGPTLNKWLDDWWADQEASGLRPATLKTRRWVANQIRAALGERVANRLKTADLVKAVDGKPPRTYQLFRSILVMIFRWAMLRDLCTVNPAEKMPVKTVKIKRQRLTEQQFWVIFRHATPLIRRAMLLALVTGQRREDIVSMKFSDIRDGVLYWTQRKTGHKGSMPVQGVLAEIVSECRDRVVSPYLIHHDANTARTYAKPGDPLFKDTLSKGFMRARDRSGLFSGLGPGEAPTFHEIRSLSGRLYKAAGGDAQALLGHFSQRTTDMYLLTRGAEHVNVEPLILIGQREKGGN